MKRLSTTQIAEYKENGYVIIKNFFETDRIEELKHDVKQVFSRKNNLNETHNINDKDFFKLIKILYKTDYKFYLGAATLCNYLTSFHALSTDSSLLNILKQLGVTLAAVCARPLMWFHSKNVASSERYYKLPAHQEWSNMQGSLDSLVVWSPLVKITKNMGRLQVSPKSHTLGLLPFGNSNEDDPYPFSINDSIIKNYKFIEVNVDITDIIVFSSFLLHRSGINKSNMLRWTFNFRYNNVNESSYINRAFPNPYKYTGSTELIDDFLNGNV